jgi:RNA polymerase sigma-70 factor (ECF subfamily)
MDARETVVGPEGALAGAVAGWEQAVDDDDLAVLLERVRAGDAESVRDLIQRFEGELRAMVRGRLPQVLRSKFDSMDFVQAIWESVLINDGPDLDRFSSPQHFRAFLAGVARNKVFAEHRKRTRTRRYNLKREEPLYVRRGSREEPRELPSSDPTPSQDAQARDRYAQLVEGRSPREVEVVELRRQGLTFDEIAERTGLGERSVRRIIDAIRARMEARKWR